jgi:hypothetical protein
MRSALSSARSSRLSPLRLRVIVAIRPPAGKKIRPFFFSVGQAF